MNGGLLEVSVGAEIGLLQANGKSAEIPVLRSVRLGESQFHSVADGASRGTAFSWFSPTLARTAHFASMKLALFSSPWELPRGKSVNGRG